ncbi:hypothetical protein [Marinobacter sp.]|uniref:hypothetical protein n=1 Tax=Marinobacter sp. TaxID=50741 RepID=UPI003A959942
MEELEVIGFIAMGAFLLLVVVLHLKRHTDLGDPENMTTIYLDQLPEVSNLIPEGHHLVKLFRQSGNPYKGDAVYTSAGEALKKVMSTFRRAKIEFVVITKNTETELSFQRGIHGHGGKQEGKKVGRAVIKRVNWSGDKQRPGATREDAKL